jgi:hypothetical protein
MPFVTKPAMAIIVWGAALAPVTVGAQAGQAAPANGAAKQLTGKERLGEKWEDEQRIDNCKVPVDKRGTKPRPAGCAHAD